MKKYNPGKDKPQSKPLPPPAPKPNYERLEGMLDRSDKFPADQLRVAPQSHIKEDFPSWPLSEFTDIKKKMYETNG